MAVVHKEIHLNTNKQFQLYPITKQVEQILFDSGINSGICNIFVPHSTAAVRLNDNEPLLHQDVMKIIYRLVPVDIAYGHDNFENRTNINPNERSNGHAHVKAFLAGSSETVPVVNGHLQLGQHQNIFFVEFDGSRSRQVNVTIIGE
ncbi:MAG: hypothetical protein A3J48_03300 [Candidatus Doudnabacteria bacterium RIFCSPHIGHO2_02_FULL_46_11]|uniref:Secondary thiamine-phosphate synthase enzyme n=1 Tax=Candidatus Doudnabacteria bacterium RIFCSPHIGHO2_02_FULL_46_11 TaxID=1817832 RepID=A0A1F5P8K3_9BACT|nr:MAG: hypothetical protein A3J48_03300 [Candidatus Doudnabacteria bacterium RIFCSPHIGHO2_02_FULL_46_11]